MTATRPPRKRTGGTRPKPVDDPQVAPAVSGDAPSTNPLGTFDFRLSVGDVEVNMVNASTLSDYDNWLFIASLASTTAVGFFVNYMATPPPKESRSIYPLITAIVFSVIFAATFWRAIQIRRAIRKGSRTVTMRATEVKSES